MLVLGVLHLIIGSTCGPLTADTSGSCVHRSQTVFRWFRSHPFPPTPSRVSHRSRQQTRTDHAARRFRSANGIRVASPSTGTSRTPPCLYSLFNMKQVISFFKRATARPAWAKTMHRAGATALAGMFTVNTVTGAWNWWDSRSVAQGRVLRTIHALTILGADAAFTYTGAKLSNEAENSLDKRREHRTVALVSIGVTVLSGVSMKLWNH